MIRSVFTAIAASLLLVGCAITTKSERARYSQARSCCESLSSLPSSAPFALEKNLKLDVNTPHYDFGFGLAPFIQYTLTQPIPQQINVMAYAIGSGKLGGGDGSWFFPDLKLLSIDDAGNIITLPEAIPKVTTYGFGGNYVLSKTVDIPTSATKLILTTNPRTLGNKDTISVMMPSGGYSAGGYYIPFRYYEQMWPYTTTVYGEAVLVKQDK